MRTLPVGFRNAGLAHKYSIKSTKRIERQTLEKDAKKSEAKAHLLFPSREYNKQHAPSHMPRVLFADCILNCLFLISIISGLS